MPKSPKLRFFKKAAIEGAYGVAYVPPREPEGVAPSNRRLSVRKNITHKFLCFV
jgi:hypothetical protein